MRGLIACRVLVVNGNNLDKLRRGRLTFPRRVISAFSNGTIQKTNAPPFMGISFATVAAQITGDDPRSAGLFRLENSMSFKPESSYGADRADDREDASNSVREKTGNKLQMILERTSVVQKEVTEIGARLQKLADRVFGPVPVRGGILPDRDGAKTRPATGIVYDSLAQLESVQRSIADLFPIITRLEEL